MTKLIFSFRKSQLAIEYSYRVRDKSPQTWVFWVHASSAARFEEAYKNIADRLGLPGRADPTINVLQLVYNWLCSDAGRRWIIILDNADDQTVFYPQTSQSQAMSVPSDDTRNSRTALAAFLPQSQNGSILITSRNMDVARKLTGGNKDIITIDTMNEHQALQLLRNKLSDTLDERASELVFTLDYMPLAITQAAAYICQRTPRTSVASYLEELRKNDKKRAYLLSKAAADLRRDEYASNSVITTWQISFDNIRREKPSAAELLSFMSLFNPQGIPEFMLRYYISTETDEDQKEEFEDDIDFLRSYSLVAVNTSGNVFDIHPLVQFVTRVWLRSFSDESKWRQKLLEALSKEFPTGQFENWRKCQTLLPHVEAVMMPEPEVGQALRDWAQVLSNAAWYMWMQGLYIEAESMIMKSVTATERMVGVDNPSTLSSVSILALVLQDQGKYEAAEEMNRRALEGMEKVLGEDHPSTLTAVYCLAYLLHRQKRYHLASELYQRAISGYKERLGRHHHSTIACSNHYSSMLREIAGAEQVGT